LLFLKNVFLFISLIIVFGPMSVYAAPVGKPQKPVAKVNGTVLTEADLEEALNEIMPAGVFHGGFSSEKRMFHMPEAIEKMIDKELFYQEAVKKGIEIDLSHLPSDLINVDESTPPSETTNSSVVRTIVDTEKKLLIDVLEECKWNKTKTAQQLGISRSTLYDKIKKYQIVKTAI